VIVYPNFVYNNTVNGKPLVYFENTSDEIIDDAGQVILIGSNNITVKGLELSNTIIGVQLLDSLNCFILDNVFSSNIFLGGIFLGNSNNNTISGNTILDNELGVWLVSSRYNTISENSFENNGANIFIINSSCNNISCNNFKYRFYFYIFNIFSLDSDNKWNGNFWNRPRLLPVLIWGFKTTPLLRMRRSLDIDWRPALRPYDIDGEDRIPERRNILYCRRGGGFRLCPIGGLGKSLQLLLSSYSLA